MLEAYFVCVGIQFGLGCFITLLSALSLRSALDVKGYSGAARDYSLNTWAPKSRAEVKFGLLMIATSPIAPLTFAASICWLLYEIGSGIKAAFDG